MEDPNSDDWLPPGWTVDVRVRKNGKRDKYYFCPSSEIKFNSKVEVFRHLDNAQNKVSVEKISPNVIVEKGVAEGFPPGWTKKTRITTKEDTVRRDSYYIDPVSGYAFRSIKDVERYLESGKIGRNAFKPKDKGSCDVELNTDKSPSASVTMKPPTLPVSVGQSSDWDMIANDQHIPRSASSGEHMHMLVAERISNQCMVGPELASSVLSRAESLDQKEGKVGLTQGALVSGCTDGQAQEKQFQESSEPKYGTENVQAQKRQRKNKQKKEINLPRRASKRLAGIKLDPVPELVTRSRGRHVAVKQSGEEETVTNVDISPNGLSDDLARQFNALEEGSEIKCNSEKHPEKTLEVHRSDKDNECFSFLPPENHATSKDCVRIPENEDKVELANLDYKLDIPLTELLTDPCIAFAFETLTGITLDPSKNSQTPSELKISHHSETPPPPPAAAVAEGLGNKNNGSGDNVFLSQENFAIPQEHAGDAKAHDNKANNENAGPSSENTLDMSSWTDPCIEFAIKTLTGTIPIDSSSDQNPKNCLQQQLSSSNNQHSDGALPSVSLDDCCNQYFGTQKPMFTQPFVDPSLRHTRNLGLGNSAGARLPHCGEDNRRNVC